MNRIVLPRDVHNIIVTLQEQGYEAYAVGGCVRDSILGRIPNDWDITTNALPEQVKALFRRTIDTGIQHGTVTIMIKETGYEVTTYRVDGDYSDGRHPDSVAFATSLREDLRRRDFTINAMAYNETEGLIDLYDGLGDLTHKIIRCVGEPRERFGEDALRLLRAVRFSAQLGFAIEADTRQAIFELAPTIAKVSRERIHTELGKILRSAHPEYMKTVSETGLLGAIMPEYAESEVVQTSFATITELLTKLREVNDQSEEGIRFELPAFYAALTYPIGEKGAVAFLKSLKLDNDCMEKTRILVRGINDCTPQVTASLVRKQAASLSPSMYAEYELLAWCLAKAMGEEGKAMAWAQERKIFEQICQNCDPLSLKELALTGNDLIAAGMKPGRELGRVLSQMLEIVLENPQENAYEKLMARYQSGAFN